MLAIERLDRSQRGAVTRAALVVDAYAALIPVIDRESVLDLAGRLARARLVQASCPRPTEHGESNRGIADRTVISARDRR